MSKNNTRKDKPDYLLDVILAVRAYDTERLANGSNKDKLHKEAVKKVELCNKELGKGYINISKARTLIQMRGKDYV